MSRNTERDAEITRMHVEGWTHVAIAAKFGISDARVSQIVHGIDRVAERRKRKPATSWPDAAKLAPAPKSSKPHHRGKSLDVVVPKRQAQAAIQAPAEYRGAVTVVTGMMQRPTLRLSPTMQANAARAGLAQKPMKAMASNPVPGWID